MKKCVCISCFDHYATRMQVIIKNFIDSGYDAKYLYASFEHYSKKENNNNYEDGIKIKVIGYKKNLSVQRLYSHMMFTKGVLKYIEQYKPHVICCNVPPNSLIKGLAKYKKKNPNVKLIFDCYDMWPESFPYHKDNIFVKIPFYLWGSLRKNYISYADTIIAVSEQGVEALRKEAKGKPMYVLKPVIDMGRLPEYKSDCDNLTFCYLGMVNHITDMDLGVELLGGIARKRSVLLHIIGEGLNLNEFVKRLEILNVKVICHGVVFDMDEKNKIFSQCNMGLNIPREEIHSTMSLKAIEYMRAGLPFVNNAMGDIRMFVEEDNLGINIDKNNIAEAIDKISRLASDDLAKMHENIILSYKNRFINQDIKSILDI